VAAGQLGIGTQIVTRAGPTAVLARIERRLLPTRVYNFEVEGAHPYFVGTSTRGPKRAKGYAVSGLPV